MEKVGFSTQARALDYSARLNLLANLRLKFAQLDNEARARHRNESTLKPPFDIKLDKTRDEARKAMGLMDHPPLSESADWIKLREDLQTYLNVTENSRDYGQNGFKAYRQIDSELNSLLFDAAGGTRQHYSRCR